jgi:uncharacterized membrane protein YuzA (DUF378 family)
MMSRSFSGVISINKKYRKEMSDNPGLMIFIGVVCSIVSTAVSSLLSLLLFGNPEVTRATFLIVGFSAIGYIIFTFFSVLFEKFIDERGHLFRVMKDE